MQKLGNEHCRYLLSTFRPIEMFPIFPLLPFKANKLFFFSDPTPNPGYMFHLVFVSLYSLSFFFLIWNSSFFFDFYDLDIFESV